MRVEAGGGSALAEKIGEGRPGASPGSPLTGRYCILSKDNSSPSQSHSQRERGVGRGRHQATPILPASPTPLAPKSSCCDLTKWCRTSSPVSIAPTPLSEHRIGGEESGEWVESKYTRGSQCSPSSQSRPAGIPQHSQRAILGSSHQPQRARLCSQNAHRSSRSWSWMGDWKKSRYLKIKEPNTPWSQHWKK